MTERDQRERGHAPAVAELERREALDDERA
jgi:hypothetical protein